MKRISFRIGCLLGFIACAALLGYALYAQFHLGLMPCPLCIFQRVAFGTVGIIFLIGAVHGPRKSWWRKAYAALAALSSLVGGAIAARHVWMTHLPADQVPSCGPPLSFMLEQNPFSDVLREVLTGSGQCAEIDWTFLGGSMPAWSLACFIGLGAWSIYLGWRSTFGPIPT